MSERVVYPGRDLEAMSFAHNYHRWILELFEPYLGSRLVEVGAGSGSFSELLLALRPDTLSLIEPSAEMYPRLVQRVAQLDDAQRVTTYNDTFEHVAARLREEARPDSIIYVNVLEHVGEDERELELVRETLTAGGRVFIFVPAFRWLYGSFDRQVGHRRRYTRAELQAKCERAGLRILKSTYFDAAGVIPWWLKYRVLRSERMEAGAVKFYDDFCVPPLKRIERLIPPPIGKNILLVAEKTGGSGAPRGVTGQKLSQLKPQ
jgi:SAM-dependent methyltransferase